MDVVSDVGERSGRGLRIGREALLGVAHAERERLGRMIQFADPETWEQPSAAPGWWNRDVMAHLAANDTAAAQLMAGQPAEELEEYRAQLGEEPFTVDGWNAWTVGRRTGLTTREILETWGRAAEAFLVYAARLDDAEWRNARFPWVAGDLSPRFLIQSQVIEWFLHGEDMRATNGVASGWQVGWQQWPVHLTIDMAVRLLPWALERAGLDLSGRSASFDAPRSRPGLVALGPRLRRGPGAGEGAGRGDHRSRAAVRPGRRPAARRGRRPRVRQRGARR